MVQPPTFIHPQFLHYICKLNRVLYNLKQAPRAWYDRLSSRLLELGFVVSKSNTSFFIYRHHHIIFYFLIYVDDVTLIGSHPEAITQILHLPMTDFFFKDLVIYITSWHPLSSYLLKS